MSGIVGMKPIAVEGAYYQEIIKIVGNYVYCAKAHVGSLNTDNVWQVCRWDTSNPFIKVYANGSEEFNNPADNLEGLTY